jgi:hypothetical protein
MRVHRGRPFTLRAVELSRIITQISYMADKYRLRGNHQSCAASKWEDREETSTQEGNRQTQILPWTWLESTCKLPAVADIRILLMTKSHNGPLWLRLRRHQGAKITRVPIKTY